jgi:hypothetical protein
MQLAQLHKVVEAVLLILDIVQVVDSMQVKWVVVHNKLNQVVKKLEAQEELMVVGVGLEED